MYHWTGQVMVPLEKEDRVTRESIKQEMVGLIQEKGYQNVTIMDICQRCGITRPTFYKYAGSREELLLDVYDDVVDKIFQDPLHIALADTHYEQLLVIFSQVVKETERYGAELFSQLIAVNLKENRQTFYMRDNMTQLCHVILANAKKNHEIHNPSSPEEIYRAIAYSFFGYETIWCMEKGKFRWLELFLRSINTITCVDPSLERVYEKFCNG